MDLGYHKQLFSKLPFNSKPPDPMKKIVLLVPAIMMLSMISNAQENIPFKTNELVISYGVYSIPDISFELGVFDEVFINHVFLRDSVLKF
jgi:hypothetical protein